MTMSKVIELLQAIYMWIWTGRHNGCPSVWHGVEPSAPLKCVLSAIHGAEHRSRLYLDEHGQERTPENAARTVTWPVIAVGDMRRTIERVTFLLPALTDEGRAAVLMVCEAAPKRDLSAATLSEEQRVREADPLTLDPEDGSLCAGDAPRNAIHGALCPVRAGQAVGRKEAQGEPLAVSRAMANAPSGTDTFTGTGCAACDFPGAGYSLHTCGKVAATGPSVAGTAATLDRVRELRRKASAITMGPKRAAVEQEIMALPVEQRRGEALSRIWLASNKLTLAGTLDVLAVARSAEQDPEIVRAYASSPETGRAFTAPDLAAEVPVSAWRGSSAGHAAREQAQAACDAANEPLTDSKILAAAALDINMRAGAQKRGGAQARRVAGEGGHCIVARLPDDEPRRVPGEVADVEHSGERGPRRTGSACFCAGRYTANSHHQVGDFEARS